MRLLDACEIVPKRAIENRRKWRLVLIAPRLYDGIDAAGVFDRANDERLFMWTKEYRGQL